MTVNLSTEQYRNLLAISLNTHKPLHQIVAEIMARELSKEVKPKKKKVNKYAKHSKISQ